MSTSIIAEQEPKTPEELTDEEFIALLEGMGEEPEPLFGDPDLVDPDDPNIPYRLDVDFADTEDQAILLGQFSNTKRYWASWRRR